MDFNDEFTCSEEQLRELYLHIKSYTLMREFRRHIRETRNPCGATIYECAYWNAHVLDNCTVYDSFSDSGASGFGGVLVEYLAHTQTSILEQEVDEDCYCEVPESFNSSR